jgi:outer membrane lipoprotein SlyB
VFIGRGNAVENVSNTRTHPLVLAAAASLLVVSAAGTAALMGWMPATRGAAEPVAAIAAAPVAPPVVAQAPEAKPEPDVKAAPEVKPAPQPTPAARKTLAPRLVAPPKTIEEPVRVAYDPPAPPRPAEPAPVVAAPPVCHDCGVVAAVRTIEKPGDGSGIGAVAGGVAGGAVGSQFGKGKGQIVGTVIGAVGGAIAGHQVERHVVRKQTQYEITVRLEDGTTRTIVQDTEPAWRPGDHVRVNGNEIRSAS